MGDAEFKRVFEASPATRRSEWASVIIYSFLLLLTLGMAGFLSVVIKWGFTTSRWLMIVGVPLGVSLIVGYLWSRSRCRFVLALEETHVQAWPLCIKYGDVDQVTFYVGAFDQRQSSTAIEITSGGKRICVRINHSDRAECVKLLQQKCRNAIIVSGSGQEYLPAVPTDKLKVVRVALARFRKRASGFVYAAIASAALAAFLLYALFVSKTGGVLCWVLLVQSIISVPFCVWQAIVYFKKASRMQESLSNLKIQSDEKQAS
jgi:hypothetical protein